MRFAGWCFFCVAFCLIASRVDAATGRRPNVIVIYSDDQGTLDLNCYGSKDLHTPHLDRLAERGVRFTQMYSPSAICSASRAGLMTGRFPARAGVPSNVSSTKGVPGMPASEVTLGELMSKEGYRTAHIGKWHLGYTPETMPNAQGFDYSFGHMGGCIDNYSHFFYWQGPNRHDLWRNGTEVFEDGEFFLDLMVDEATQFIRSPSEKPFFMYWAINAPHYPMQGTSRWRDHYRHLDSPRRQYAEFVSTVDEKVGAILECLDELSMTDNTLVVFQSDHGHSTEDRAFGGGGNAGPYRGAKGCLFEAGIRVPAIVSLPGTIPTNEVRDHLATGCDWYPTIADFCGLPLPGHHLDGRSLKNVIESKDSVSPHASFFWLLGRGERAQWAVRRGDWKLLGNPADRSEGAGQIQLPSRFLVNLAEDISESKNLAAEHPEIVQELETIMQQHVVSIDEPK
ncbi:MAG: sulfatase-like hydrolase/transferase [Rubripirellula sp.]